MAGVAPIVAPLNYLAPGCAAVRTWACAPPHGQPRFNRRLQAYPMPIEDVGSLREPARLDTQGFALCARRSAVCDFWDEDELRAVYHAEAERLQCELTGASRALVFDHTLRRRAGPPLDGTGGSFASSADLACNELIYADRRGETYIGRHNPAHRWFRVSNQTRDEVIVFESFDSARADVHTAFEHPETPPDTPLRESVEPRAIAFYS